MTARMRTLNERGTLPRNGRGWYGEGTLQEQKKFPSAMASSWGCKEAGKLSRIRADAEIAFLHREDNPCCKEGT
jgi:hypothetical protein